MSCMHRIPKTGAIAMVLVTRGSGTCTHSEQGLEDYRVSCMHIIHKTGASNCSSNKRCTSEHSTHCEHRVWRTRVSCMHRIHKTGASNAWF